MRAVPPGQSALLLYSNAMRDGAKVVHPKATCAEITMEMTTMIARNFKKLPTEERKCWDRKAVEDKEHYDKEMLAKSDKIMHV